MALVSVNAEDLRQVVQLACLTESRDNGEQAALLRVAHKCDQVLDYEAAVADSRAGRIQIRDGFVYAAEGAQPAQASTLERQADGSRLIDEAGHRRIKPSWERKGGKGRPRRFASTDVEKLLT